LKLITNLQLPHNQQRQIVRLSRAPREFVNCIQNRLHHGPNPGLRTSRSCSNPNSSFCVFAASTMPSENSTSTLFGSNWTRAPLISPIDQPAGNDPSVYNALTLPPRISSGEGCPPYRYAAAAEAAINDPDFEWDDNEVSADDLEDDE
jgi:hypothetical protein